MTRSGLRLRWVAELGSKAYWVAWYSTWYLNGTARSRLYYETASGVRFSALRLAWV